MKFECEGCMDMKWIYLPNEDGFGGVPCMTCNADGLAGPCVVGGRPIKPDMNNPVWIKWRSKVAATRLKK